MITSGTSELGRLLWLGPLTVAVAVTAVVAVQAAVVRVLHPLPRFSESLLQSTEPALATGFFVACGIGVFAATTKLANNPVQAFRRIALGALLVSFVPNVLVAASGMRGADWPSMIALMLLHVVAWAVTVAMLTTLTRSPVQDVTLAGTRAE
jgi:Zn-dependent protease